MTSWNHHTFEVYLKRTTCFFFYRLCNTHDFLFSNCCSASCKFWTVMWWKQGFNINHHHQPLSPSITKQFKPVATSKSASICVGWQMIGAWSGETTDSVRFFSSSWGRSSSDRPRGPSGCRWQVTNWTDVSSWDGDHVVSFLTISAL